MEDVLDLYAEPYNSDRPVVGFDERPLQLQGETRVPIPAAPGRVRRIDYEYHRLGTGNVFTTVEPLAGWRHVAVTERRTTQDFAHQMRWLVDEAYPEAQVIRVVLDNLNSHTTASLYATFPAAEARRLGAQAGVSSHTQARQLAERRGVRAGGVGHAMPQSSAAGPGHGGQRGGGLGTAKEPRSTHRQGLFTTAQARRKLPYLYPTPGVTSMVVH